MIISETICFDHVPADHRTPEDLPQSCPAFWYYWDKGKGKTPMKKTISLLQKMGLTRPKQTEDDDDLSQFDKRLKMVNRARVVNQVGLGGPVFKSRQTESEA